MVWCLEVEFGGVLGGADGSSLKIEPMCMPTIPIPLIFVVGGGFGGFWSCPGDSGSLVPIDSASASVWEGVGDVKFR